MTLLIKGAGKWSQIIIDADKDMAGKGLSDLKELALGMVQGDMIVKGSGGVLIRVPAGIANTVWTSNGPGDIPSWQPGGTFYNRFFPASISITKTLTTRAGPDKVASKSPSMDSVYIKTLGDDVAEMVKLLASSITLRNTAVIDTVDKTAAKAPVVDSAFDLIKVVEGAVAQDFSVGYTDETTPAQNATANDMTLFPAAPANNDAYYFGSSYKFDEIILNIGIAGNGVWTYVWEYYDVDTTWHSLAGVTDGTVGFTAAAGNHSTTFTRPASWATVAVGGVGPFYWIRCRIVLYTSVVTQPKGTQSWYKITT